MVQVLPYVPSLGERLIEPLQQAGQKALTGYQLGQGLQQLQGAKTPVELGTALVRLSAQIPGSERYIAPLYQSMLQQIQGNQTPSIPSITGGTPGDQTQRVGTPQTPLQQYLNVPGRVAEPTPKRATSPMFGQPARPGSQNKPAQGAQSVAPSPRIQPESPGVTPLSGGTGIQLGSLVNLDPNQLVSPETQSEILRKVKIAGGDVDFTRKQIEDYNAGKIAFNDLINANVNRQAAQVQRQFDLEDQIKHKIDQQLGGTDESGNRVGIPESKKNLYYSIVNKELPFHKDFTSAWQAVSKKIADFDKLERKVVESIPEAGSYGLTKTQEKAIGNAAKPLLATDPLAYNILEEAFVQKGDSIVDAAKALKPLPQPAEKIVDSANDFRDLVYPKFSFFHEVSDKEMLSNIDKAIAGQEEQIPSIIGKLKSIWDDEISLINIYADLSKKGWFPKQILSMFDELSDRFNSQQQVERAQLSKHPRIPGRYLLE